MSSSSITGNTPQFKFPPRENVTHVMQRSVKASPIVVIPRMQNPPRAHPYAGLPSNVRYLPLGQNRMMRTVGSAPNLKYRSSSSNSMIPPVGMPQLMYGNPYPTQHYGEFSKPHAREPITQPMHSQFLDQYPKPYTSHRYDGPQKAASQESMIQSRPMSDQYGKSFTDHHYNEPQKTNVHEPITQLQSRLDQSGKRYTNHRYGGSPKPPNCESAAEKRKKIALLKFHKSFAEIFGSLMTETDEFYSFPPHLQEELDQLEADIKTADEFKQFIGNQNGIGYSRFSDQILLNVRPPGPQKFQ
ncbi:hypothetical protein FO519_005671 [Halicephalobus sp. NKZ332]|nr:hypothetical protein FO519_005671 [Halicephalobus sp. NKZ332]